jgi:catechol 2,3-dioxygenase
MTAETTSQDLLPAELTRGTGMLKVGDMKLMTDYYQRALGLDVVAEQDGGLYLGRLGKPLVHLAGAPGLNLPGRGEAGLFHTALLFADQAALAATVATAAQYEPRSFTGSADHLVSEAFYFNDPEGNGIELYWDRPRKNWSWNGTEVVMDSLALPPQRYLQEHLTQESVESQQRTAAGVGHVHLQVGDVHTAQDFYVGTLGFEKTAGWHGQALFVSAGRYHHHMAMNVWNSRGAGPRKDTLGLGEVLIEVPSGDDVGALADRLKVAGVPRHHTGAELRFEDPWRNRIRAAVRQPGAAAEAAPGRVLG